MIYNKLCSDLKECQSLIEICKKQLWEGRLLQKLSPKNYWDIESEIDVIINHLIDLIILRNRLKKQINELTQGN